MAIASAILAGLMLLISAFGPALAGESSDLADAFALQGNLDEALKYYRRALGETPADSALWERYDETLLKSLLARGVVLSPLLQPPPSQSAAPAATAPAPDPGTSNPPAPRQLLPSIGGARRSGSVAPAAAEPPVKDVARVYRPAERVPLGDEVDPDQETIIDGGRFEVSSVMVEHNSRGSVRVRGKLQNKSRKPMNYPRVYVSIYDRQDQMQGRTAGYLARGTYFLPAGASEVFEVNFPTYRGPVGAYAVEITANQ